MPRIELIYDKDCPNVRKARANLIQALTESQLPAKWEEWDRERTGTPGYAKAYGSPTILINGKDIAGANPGEGAACCRLYLGPDGKSQGVPSVPALVAAFEKRRKEPVAGLSLDARREKKAWKIFVAVIPGASMALLPKLACPACWPAYAGFLSAMGLGFVNYTPYLLPMTIAFLLLAALSLGYRAKYRRGYGPLLVGFFSGAVVVVGKFILNSEPALYAGIGLLMAASAWNAWPRKKFKGPVCPACTPATSS